MSVDKTPRPTVGQLSIWAGGRSRAPASLLSRRIGHVWTDSRKIGRGDIFVAIETERDDGHGYVADALKAGAIAAVIDRRKEAMFTSRQLSHLIVVSDSVKALQRMGAAYRKEMGILFVGITGSNGKTTTRSFMGSVLGQAFTLGETYTNWNNHLGVPLSILRFAGDEWIGLIEMGANHLHEIRTLSRIAHPDIAVITNIGHAHIGLFGSLAATTAAKFEIVEGLDPKGFLVLNGDDPRLVAHSRTVGRQCFFFGTSPRCDIRARDLSLTKDFHARFVVDGVRYELPVPGRHFVYSVLPAIFLARRFGMPEQDIVESVRELRTADMRGGIQKRGRATFIVDCYNANPSSMAQAIEVLREHAPSRKRVAIVGDMLELGTHAGRLHEALGRRLGDSGIDRVIAVGEFAQRVKDGMGTKAGRAVVVEDARQAARVAGELIKQGDTVLLKGSRGVRLEVVLDQFV